MISLQDLRELLFQRPVLLGPNPFVPICLAPAIEIMVDGGVLAAELDSPLPHRVRSVALIADTTPGGSRFGPPIDVVMPAPAEINAGLSIHTAYVRTAFLQQSAVAAHIVAEAMTNRYEAVVLMIVDGLSYADVQHWPWPTLPCFVDGPSITTAGYPNVIGQPPLARQLEAVGLRQAIGFSYWGRSNSLTDQLFVGVPLRRVNNFAQLLADLQTVRLRGTYVQIVREGLDRWAHNRREVTKVERETTVGEIARNCMQIAEQMADEGLHGAIYLTADHGILWKAEHSFVPLDTTDHRHPRYSSASPKNPEHALFLPFGDRPYYSYYYPYVGAAIPDNAAGVHGGCSYEESFVPFVCIEVSA